MTSHAALEPAASPTVAARLDLVVQGGVPRGAVSVPGDKSLSHRALLFAGLAAGESRLDGLLHGGDAAATVGVLRGLGVQVEELDGPASVRVFGAGLDGLREPSAPLDCVRSGTTMRLLTGILAGRPFTSVLTGDPQLLRRPMRRVLAPMAALGAQVLGRAQDTLAPFALRAGAGPNGVGLVGRRFELQVASAQVKSAILLAGLQADGVTEVVEPALSRDHTERMLAALGAPMERDGLTVRVRRLQRPWSGFAFRVPGDPSSAAFLLGAASIVPGADVQVDDVCLNPTRTAFLDVLRRAGATVEIVGRGERLGEPVGDVRVRGPGAGGRLRGVEVQGAEVPALIDEVPLLAVVLAHAEGPSRIRDAGELRVKESDRISSVVAGLAALGASVDELPDGMTLQGGGLRVAAAGDGDVARPRWADSVGDHRLAMAFAIAGLPQGVVVGVRDAACSDDSFPGFAGKLRELGLDLAAVAGHD